MITLNEDTYKNLARILFSHIGYGYYFNGSVEIDAGEWRGILRTTLLIYREPLFDPADPSGAAERIAKIVPVWWEFESGSETGMEDNDFSWREFQPYLLSA